MSVNELIIEILNCIAESSIIIFYLYNMMKESFRVRKRAIFPATLLTSMILAAVTLFFEYPWINLIATFVLMTAVSNIMFECKFGKKTFLFINILDSNTCFRITSNGNTLYIEFRKPLGSIKFRFRQIYWNGLFKAILFLVFGIYNRVFKKQAERYSIKELAVNYINTDFKCGHS